MGIAIIGILIFINVIMALTLRIAGNPHKNVILENTLPPDKLTDPEVTEISKVYKRKLWQIALIFSVLALACFFLPYDSLLMTGFWLILISSMAVFYRCEIVYIRKMQQLTIKNNWRLPVEPILLDTKLIQNKNVKMISWVWFLPPLILILGGFFLSSQFPQEGLVMMALISLFLWLTFVISWYFIARLPVRPLTDKPEINQSYNDLTKHHWSLMMVVLSWLFAPLLFLPIFSFHYSGWLGKGMIVLFIVLLLAGLIFSVCYSFDLRKKQDRLLSQAAGLRYYGDDQFWRYGVYVNPNDPRLMVPDRLGLNLSFNLGRPSGKILMGIVGIFILGAFFFTLIPLYFFDFTSDPFTMNINQKIEIKAPLTTTSEISLKEVTAVALLEKMPEKIVRVNGFGTAHYATGRFRVAGKSATLYIDRNSKPILAIKTAKRTYYYTNKQPQKTKELYQKLQEKLN